ncbi:MAG: sodium:solute symporter family transporter, partial [Aurantibacter sp.]
DERNAMGATLLFNIAHYALRPWPWILIALASIVVFPNLSDLQSAFPNLPLDKLGHDVAYPAMLTLLPTGLLGVVAASLIAAFMSTISTQLNLGASYLVNDFYQRFIKPDATQHQLVWAGRSFTVLTMVLGTGLGLLLTDAGQAFDLLLLLGAGTGLIYILRWFWWRINAYTEIIAMVSSLIIAVYFTFLHDKTGFLPLEPWMKTVLGAGLSTAIWVFATYVTPGTEESTLRRFYQKIKPGGPGWDKVVQAAKSEGVAIEKEQDQLPMELLGMVLGCITVYAALFATGFWIYGQLTSAVIFTMVAGLGALGLFQIFSKIRTEKNE